MKKKTNDWVNARDWLMAKYARMKLTPEQIKVGLQETQDFINRHPELDQIKTKK